MRFVLEMRRLGQRARQRLEIVDGAAEHLPVGDSSIDAAWAVNMMHHWTDPDAGVSELRRVLRGGGRLLLVDEDFDDPGHPEHERMRARRRKHGHAFPDIDPAAVGSRIAADGFTVEEANKTVLAGRPAKLIRATKLMSSRSDRAAIRPLTITLDQAGAAACAPIGGSRVLPSDARRHPAAP